MRNKPCLTASDARKIMMACKSTAEQKNWNVSMAIVDDGGYLVHLERLDGAVLPSPEVAILKARTAALSRAPTKSLEEVVEERPATATFPGRLPVQGGVDLFSKANALAGSECRESNHMKMNKWRPLGWPRQSQRSFSS